MPSKKVQQELIQRALVKGKVSLERQEKKVREKEKRVQEERVKLLGALNG